MEAKFKVGDVVIASNKKALRDACLTGAEATETFSTSFTVMETRQPGADEAGTVWSEGVAYHKGWYVPMSALELAQ